MIRIFLNLQGAEGDGMLLRGMELGGGFNGR